MYFCTVALLDHQCASRCGSLVLAAPVVVLQSVQRTLGIKPLAAIVSALYTQSMPWLEPSLF